MSVFLLCISDTSPACHFPEFSVFLKTYPSLRMTALMFTVCSEKATDTDHMQKFEYGQMFAVCTAPILLFRIDFSASILRFPDHVCAWTNAIHLVACQIWNVRSEGLSWLD